MSNKKLITVLAAEGSPTLTELREMTDNIQVVSATEVGSLLRLFSDEDTSDGTFINRTLRAIFTAKAIRPLTIGNTEFTFHFFDGTFIYLVELKPEGQTTKSGSQHNY